MRGKDFGWFPSNDVLKIVSECILQVDKLYHLHSAVQQIGAIEQNRQLLQLVFYSKVPDVFTVPMGLNLVSV